MNNFSIQSIYNWYRNSIRNPKYRWWLILGTIVYIISPIDIAPDFIPMIGQIDDVVILTLLVSEVSQWLIDSVKSRQTPTVNTETDNPTEKTVDVESVSVQ
ncbi:YkvA family protein [Limnofasciculus baicalensis]|uniref:YkvA family protein n=1 Tax=Limnofasciculus baicalensis BBK-W-15 TaxID=2699891 RepID=A0AAE3GU56_9CYAN|nr:YkvA family protein [Limnofasciculus baicalensis]MCP2730721.1 YkvA family protein [Limnofasciculus baicalensis BBK-W-15]